VSTNLVALILKVRTATPENILSELKHEISYSLFCFFVSYNIFSGIPTKARVQENGVNQASFPDDVNVMWEVTKDTKNRIFSYSLSHKIIADYANYSYMHTIRHQNQQGNPLKRTKLTNNINGKITEQFE
jgi:hypothetical protein